MDVHTEITRLALGPNETMVLERALGVEVIGRTGSVWLTQSGDSRDIVLGPGQCFTLGQASKVVMTTARGAEFILRSSHHTASPRRGWLRRLADWFKPHTGSRVCAALDGRVCLHRVA